MSTGSKFANMQLNLILKKADTIVDENELQLLCIELRSSVKIIEF